ncbi:MULTISPECIES: cation-translocating P-type ATPase [unclassified Polaromonas]|uniref:heavy metal translocating P-type ATPase n=1 Tax=unclassified Polaromonas TaxID=2638319 RepID=UPI0018CA164C|nr:MULTISPECIES: cation-translocating P-type ATPase [unclassified Polaromonas]MBG6073276.1 Cu2+-exporting ATPase [Polaromonas sp. CG_9.7]MBG6115215.1 Cu2+-exporting ATPase [Polaromonas sp. CG_9.2]MDH6183439.1 Cu2+-exporting ATPase [Polaromonas sp. CG_23.6]
MQTASLSPLSLPSSSAADELPAPTASGTPLALLDEPDEWSAFSRPLAGQPSCWESSVVFEGMHCAACALTIEDALRKVPGVLSADISAASHRGRIVWSDTRISPSGWMQAAARAGYPAVPASDAFANDRRRVETRQALWRLGVAGLCMMQVMMYAWPAYVAEPGDLAPDMARLLRWASWVLSLPVLLFSCAPFFRNALRDLRHRRISMDLPVALGMGITFAVSSMGTFEPGGIFGAEVYFDSFTMFVFFLLTGRWLELRLQGRTAGALEALMNRLPDSVERRGADGVFERVAVRRLGAGDVIRVLPGEAFPADGVILEGRTLADESLLTGESRPLPRDKGGCVIAGSHNLAAPVVVKVELTGGQTRFAQIVALMESASTSKPQLAQLADRIAKPFLLLVLVAAGGAGAYWWSHDPGHALMVAVAVLIVTCPCALSLATPAAMLASAGSLARSGVLVRRLQALEALATVDTVVFDKTGTLTRDAFALGEVHTRQGISRDEALAMAAALGKHSLHPVSRALSLAGQGGVLYAVQDARETPGQGVSGRLCLGDTAASAVMARLGSARFCEVEPPVTTALHACLSDDQGWVATFELKEDLRPDAHATVAALMAQGVKVYLLSGDLPESAARVARQAGIDNSQGGCTPQDKLVFLRHLQSQGHHVAMVGDGLNDGPVLAGAHVSFAFGQAVPLAQAQSDLVVLGGRLGTVAQTLAQARRTLGIVHQNLWWAAVYNAVCVPLAVAGWLPAWLAGIGMALSSLLVVLNALRLSSAIAPLESD